MVFFQTESINQNRKNEQLLVRSHKKLSTFLRDTSIYIVSIAVIVLGIFIFYFYFAQGSQAAWFNDEYHYRQIFTFTHNADISAERAITFSLDTAELITAGVMQSDCDDTRFTDINGKVLRYQLTGTCNNAATTYEVVFPKIINGTNTGYVYYGNPSALTASIDVSGVTALTPSGGDPAITDRTNEVKGSAPVLYWKFNDGTGSTTQDSTSQNNDGTISGAAWELGGISANKREFSLKFDGSNDFVSKSYSSDTELNPGTANMTVSAWFRHSSSISGTDVLISRYNAGGYEVYMKSTGVVCFGLDDSGATFSAVDEACSTSSYADSKWHFVEAVKNGNSSLTLYIDGKSAGTDSSLTVTGSISGSSPTFYVGIDSDGTSNPWTGFIDDIKVYTNEQSARSAAQVKADFVARSSAEGNSAVLGQDNSDQNLTSGLVGHWKMDESGVDAEGETSSDSSGNANTATLYGDNGVGDNGSGLNCTATGRFGSGCTLDGTDDYLDAGTASSLAPSSSMTISVWLKRGATGGNQYLVTKDRNPDPGGYGLYFKNDTLNYFYGSSSGWRDVITSSTFTSTSLWYHVLVVHGNSYQKIYVNGTEQALSAGGSFSDFPLASGNSFKIGTFSSQIEYFNGTIDEVRVYNRALSVNEIQQLYNFAPGPVGYWKFDENTGSSTTYDSSGNENDLSLTGTGDGGGEAGAVFKIDHEEGDLTDYSSTSDSNSELSVTGGAALAGTSFGLAVTGTDSGSEFGRKDFTALTGTDFRSRFYFDPNSITSLTNDFRIVTYYAGTDAQVRVLFSKSGSDYNLTLHILNDAGSNNIGTTFTITDAPHYIEIWVTKATTCSPATNDAVGRIYLDGALKDTISGLDLCDLFTSIDNVRVGHTGGAATFTGSLYLDEIVMRNDATEIGSVGGGTTTPPQWSIGKFGSALQFSANDDLLTRADDPDFDFADDADMTISAWFKHTTASSQEVLLSKYNEAGYKILMEADGDITCALDYDSTWSPTDSVTSTAATYDDGNWHHLECVKTGASSLALYIDSVLVNSDSSISATNTLTNSDPLYIGIDADGESLDYTGTLDDIKIYNYVRTPAQIIEDLNAGHPAPGSPVGSPVAYWKLDQGYGTNADDSSENNNDLTLNSASWTTEGKFNKAWNGTGGDLRMSRSSDSDLEFSATEDFTISLWYKSDSTNNPSAIEYLVNNGAAAGSAGYAIYANTSGFLCFGIDDDASWGPDVASCTTTDVYDNTWHHVTAVRNVTLDKTFIYLDARERDSDTDTTSATLDSSPTFFIGDIDTDNAGSGEEFAGDIDEIKVFRLALTPEQVRTDFNRGQAVVYGALSTTSAGNISSDSYSREYCVPGDSSTCNSPLAEWRFEEGSGSTANDSSGNGATGTATGTTIVSGKTGKAREFTASDNVSATISDPGNTNTLSLWIYPTSSIASKTILTTSKLTTDSSSRPIYGACTGTTISLNQWTHITAISSGAGSCTIYQNGVQTATGATGVSFGTAIGIGQTSFIGIIDEVKVFDEARSAAQIAWDYNRGKPVGHWKLDENQGISAGDSSGNGYTGTLTNSPTWASGTGKYNNAVTFANSNNHIDIGDQSSLELTTFTISAWFNRSGNCGTFTECGIIGKGASGNIGYDLIVDNAEGPFKASLFLRDDSQRIYGTSTINTNQWYHLAASIDGTTAKVYVNGKLEKSVSQTTTPVFGAESFMIGNRSGLVQPGEGTIDDARIYNYALTDTQIKTLYNQDSAVRYGPITGTP